MAIKINMMEKNSSYFLFLLWLCYLIVSSVLLFTRGFLLTRVVQDRNATCESFDNINCGSVNSSNAEQYSGESCSRNEKIHRILKHYKTTDACLPVQARVVLLIIDGLRYDFTVYNDSNKNPLAYQNKISVISKLLKSYPEHTRHYKFVADPPTTTMQRIKALTTGSLPTFIDAGSNFASFEINEDNIIDQMLRKKSKVVFMGDDTWNGLYPNRFVRNYPYPSFDVWDLDTVDEGVQVHLYDELNNTDWNLLIGHFLGVDHCGHRYGPNHPEMERKLKEINVVIENVLKQMDETTMLFVIGDHGMTITGDHGGASEDEVTAGFFVYSRQPLMDFDKEKDFIKQIDIVPTLAAILGIPIPFQNLGILILNCLPILTESLDIEIWRLGLYYLWVNVNQVFTYIKEYSKSTNSFNEGIINNFDQNFAVLKRKWFTVNNEVGFSFICKDAIEFISALRKMCESIWIQFDSFSISRGLLLLFTSLFFVFLIIDGIPYEKIANIFTSSFVPNCYMMLILAAVLGYILYYFEFVDNLLTVLFFSSGIGSQIMLVLLSIQNWEMISHHWYDKNRNEKIPNVVCRIVLILNLCGLFSNSYIVEESFVHLFLMVTIVFVGIIGVTLSNKVHIKGKLNMKNILSWSKLRLFLLAILIAVIVRFSSYFWRCREEQQWCFIDIYEDDYISGKIETTKVQWVLAITGLAMFVFFVKEWLRSCGNLNGCSLTITLVKYLPSAAVVCIAGFWFLKKNSTNKERVKLLRSADMLALMAYALIFIGITLLISKPLCIYMEEEINSTNESKSFPFTFKKFKKTFLDKKKATENIPIIFGLGTVYSSVFTILGLYTTLLFVLLLNEAIAPSAIIMFITAAFLLIITSLLRIETATSMEQLFDVPNISIVAWIILAQYFFYGSGHQPTFPNIAWEAAFVGTFGNFTNNIIPGTLIIMNTFCSYILMGLLLPLLFITPFSIFIMIPSIVNNKSNGLKSASVMGEIILVEQNNLTLTSIFVLSCKYIMGHGIRVFATMLAATIHSRHLMVWNIFAPKFIFESIGMFVTLISVVISYLIFYRINKKVCNLINTVCKSK